VPINTCGEAMTQKSEYHSALGHQYRQIRYRDVATFLMFLLFLSLSVDATENDPALHEARKLYREALKLRDAGRYDEAIPLFERVLETRERILGQDHREIADTLNGLGVLYYYKGDYERAEPLCQRALTIREKVLGPDHPDVAASLNNLALLCIDRGDYAEAVLLGQRALAIKERALGPDHPDVATYIHNLALFYHNQGNYAKAERLYERALPIREKALGPEHRDVAQTLNNLANIYRDRGDYAKAEPLYGRAVTTREKALGPEHPDVAQSLRNLAKLYWDKGDYTKAESLFGRSLALKEKRLGPEHLDIATSLTGLAIFYCHKGDYAKAEMLHRRALAVREKALGPEHSEVAISYDNLALVYAKKGEYAEAEPIFQRALAIREKALGPEHPYIADSLNNLAILYRDRAEYAKAESVLQRALAIREKVLGQEHPAVVATLNDLAELSTAKGEVARAIAYQSRANAASERNLAINLTSGSERQKLAYLALFSRQTDFTLSLHNQVAPDNPLAFDLAFATTLCRKGRGLDAMTDAIATLRRRAKPEDQALLDQLAEARSHLAAFTLRDAALAKPQTYRAQLRPLEEKVENLEAKLSAHSAAFRAQAQPVTLAAVRSALPANSALVEFVVFTPRELPSGRSKPPRYLVYLLTASGQPRYVDLGEAAIIDRAVGAWRKALRNPHRTDVKRLAREVDEKIMRPVRSLLGETRHLLIAPDGQLNLIPFAALVDEHKRYLVEGHTISYLTSGRDLLRLQTPEPSQSAPLIVANPIFGRVETLATRTGQGNSSAEDQVWGQIDPTNIFFQSLPSTEREALAIKAVVPAASLLLRGQATETALKQSRAPRILHIATHGFFLSNQEAPPVETLGVPGDNSLRLPMRLSRWAAKIANPLLRSGLVLAGVNERRSGDDDGVLTALEVASLDLWGTRLVVLSACDTGIGEVKNGEGVYGLRRALVLAGSETQILSLWPVSDRETRSLMAGYYGRLLKGEGRGEALRQIQLGMLKDAKLQHPHYWGNFIQAGEWANLDGQR
jgi:CHAT domain-containing protein/Tfp pilus assembly protein PilF